MPKNEDGEFELILGNRQLLSVFFIVVVLLAIFFALGYIVGRPSSPAGAPDHGSERLAPPHLIHFARWALLAFPTSLPVPCGCYRLGPCLHAFRSSSPSPRSRLPAA